MMALLISSGIALATVAGFAIVAIAATRKAGRLDVALCKAQIQVALLESDLVASRQQRKDLADAVIAARNLARQFEMDLERAAHALSRDDLARLRADVRKLLSFADEADSSHSDSEPDKLPAVGGAVSGELDDRGDVP